MLTILASWVNRQQQEVIEYPRTENAVLKEKFHKKRILLTDEQRRRLAVQGKMIGRKALHEVGSLLTPDTILRWHRQLVARKLDDSDRKEKKSGRPRTRQVIVDLAVKFAKENPTWASLYLNSISTENWSPSTHATADFPDRNVRSNFLTPRVY